MIEFSLKQLKTLNAEQENNASTTIESLDYLQLQQSLHQLSSCLHLPDSGRTDIMQSLSDPQGAQMK